MQKLSIVEWLILLNAILFLTVLLRYSVFFILRKKQTKNENLNSPNTTVFQRPYASTAESIMRMAVNHSRLPLMKD